MPDKYYRPASAAPPLRYVQSAPPVVTAESAYQLSKGAEDLGLSRKTSVLGQEVAPRVQTAVTTGVGALAAVKDYLDALTETRETAHLVEATHIAQQIKEQLQPGQAVEVVVSYSEGHHNVEVLPSNTKVMVSKESAESKEVVVRHVQKPGPGDLQCVMPQDSIPVTTVFKLKDKQETTIKMDQSRLSSNEKPVEAASSQTRPTERPTETAHVSAPHAVVEQRSNNEGRNREIQLP